MSLLRYNFMIEAVECYQRAPKFIKESTDGNIALWMLGASHTCWYSRVDREEATAVDLEILCLMLPAIRKQVIEQEEADAQ